MLGKTPNLSVLRRPRREIFMQPADEPTEVVRIEAGRLTEARLMEIVFPGQTNQYGTLFGGEALALMDKAASVAAARYARRAVVTARSEKVDFHVPIKQGQLVELIARVIET